MEDENLRGIKGWLIFVAVGIVLTPLLMIRQIYLDYQELLNNGLWTALTTPGFDTYMPAWKTLVWCERLTNGGMVLIWFYIGFLFFYGKKSFPIW